MSVYSFANNPEGDSGWFVHRTALYFLLEDVFVCRKHSGGIALQPVTTLDVEHGAVAKCFMCRGGPMHGLKFGIRRIVHGPIWGTDQVNPKYEDALVEAARWAQAGILYKGRCPVCQGVILDD